MSLATELSLVLAVAALVLAQLVHYVRIDRGKTS